MVTSNQCALKDTRLSLLVYKGYYREEPGFVPKHIITQVSACVSDFFFLSLCFVLQYYVTNAGDNQIHKLLTFPIMF